MKIRRIILLLLAAALLAGTCLAAETGNAAETRDNGCPYYIMVNRKMNTVTIYGLDEYGYYSVPVKAMVCSTARWGYVTPLGTYSVTGLKNKWNYMVDGSYGQYAVQFYGNYLFHSVCYYMKDPSTLMTEEYNSLGTAASRGCVRLQVADAKWIFDNCSAGTVVTVYESDDPGPLGKPSTEVDYISAADDCGWEPTDPRPENPWHSRTITDFRMVETSVSMEAGTQKTLGVIRTPPGSYPETTWYCDNPAVAKVSSTGVVTALSEGSAMVTASCGDFRAECAVHVSGVLLPFYDVPIGAWYYSDLRYAYERSILAGTGNNAFEPEGRLLRAEMAQILYNLAGRPKQVGQDPVSDGGEWYDEAMDWAEKNGIVRDKRNPEVAVTRLEIAAMIYQYETRVRGRYAESSADLSGFRDLKGLSEEELGVLRWAVGNRILYGDGDGTLTPGVSATRAQTAALLRRYLER